MVTRYRDKYELIGLNGPIPEDMINDLDASYGICKSMNDHNSCEMCGKCCYQPFIIVRDSDIEPMAEKLELPLRQFITTYLYRDHGKWFIKETSPCVFLGEDNRCKIHDVRPEVCRDFPYMVSTFMSRVYLALKDETDHEVDTGYMDHSWPCTLRLEKEVRELIASSRRRDP